MKDCEPEKGVNKVREGGFALGVERGREEVRCDRREGEQPKGKCTYAHSPYKSTNLVNTVSNEPCHYVCVNWRGTIAHIH